MSVDFSPEREFSLPVLSFCVQRSSAEGDGPQQSVDVKRHRLAFPLTLNKLMR